MSQKTSQFLNELAEQAEKEKPGGVCERPRRRPMIGMPAGKATLRDGAWQVYGGDQPTIDALAEVGGAPQILPTFPIVPGLDPFDMLLDKDAFQAVFETIWSIMRDLNGLVLTGGNDLDSRFFYHAIPHPQLQPADLWRDIWEWFAVLLAYATSKPIFGICRGMQVINVSLGGCLFQDHAELTHIWPKGMPPLLRHRKGRSIYKNLITHPVFLVPQSKLAQSIQGQAALPYRYLDGVFSQHHQFVGLLDFHAKQVLGTLAPDLKVTGYAPDGVIEALESRDTRRFCAGVQFHPEYSSRFAWARGIFATVIAEAARESWVDRAVYDAYRPMLLAWLWDRLQMLHGVQEKHPSMNSVSSSVSVPLFQTEQREEKVYV